MKSLVFLASVVSALAQSSSSSASVASASSASVASASSASVASASSASVASASSASVASSAAAASSSAAAASSSSVLVSSSASVASSTSSSASGTSSVSSSASPSASASFPSCPQNNGQSVTYNGFTFVITCGAGTVTRRSLPAGGQIAKRQIAGLNSFGLCIAGCASTVGCQSVLFNPATNACAVYNCVVAVPAGLAGARVVSGPQGPIVTQACAATIPQNIPVVNNTINLNLNITIDIDIVINAFDYHGLPITSICKGDKCGKSKGGNGECDVCKPIPKEQCCICYQPEKHQEPPMKPKPDYKPKCDKCDEYKSTYTKPAAAYTKPADYSPSQPTGKYTGPYSNDAITKGASMVTLAGAAVLALML